MLDSSFKVALLGSTPRVREKSFVAISILSLGIVYCLYWFIGFFDENTIEKNYSTIKCALGLNWQVVV